LTSARSEKNAANPHADRRHDRRLLRLPEAGRRRAAIGAHQPAGAQKNAAEPACDDHRNLIEFLALDGLENGSARRARRFAVIAEPVDLTDPPGPAIMIGVEVGIGGQKRPRFRLIHHWSGDGQKAALLDVLRKAFDAVQRKHGADLNISRILLAGGGRGS